ncbi:uncharacterized protein LOC128206844 isoform X2 [Mya arenaria]|uniref:uncharacterized protein LOC128206844 isoform X1 n=1 Tax=Mya arenaria TaxID=6604 RepID=UPI0022E82FFA|nr:uncharacterized protein LOC128206844 isoform X1 [Mya arenaria]XP_052765500.1 uncharacterized protein LOC128206844 isoform X2 [Mya arenaria]
MMNFRSDVPPEARIGAMAASESSSVVAECIVFYCQKGHLECRFYDYEGPRSLKVDNYKEIFQDVNIHTVQKYNHPLNAWQITRIFLRHDYIIFEASDGKWYSVEKNTTCILIQRGSKEQVSERTTSNIRHFFTSRLSCSQPEKGQNTLYLLIAWLIKNETANGYCLIRNNCQNFAKRVFKFLTQ